MKFIFTSIKKNIYSCILSCLIVILFGFLVMFFFSDNKKLPVKVALREKSLLVKALQIEANNYPVNIKGFGVVRPFFLMSLAPEVTGKIVYKNPNLKPGGVIFANEILFKIDDFEYKVALCKAETDLNQCKINIEKLKKQYSIDKIRLNILERNKEIAFCEFKQIEKNFNEHNIGNQFELDSFEESYNNSLDYFNQIKKTILLYPIQINELENLLKLEKAKLLLAKANLQKCSVNATFSSRVKSCSIEVGEVVSIGQNIALLADDSILEIEVLLDSNDVKKWIQFEKKNKEVLQKAQFGKVKLVNCEIIWDESNANYRWIGYLDHIVGFEEKSRNIKAVVRINTSNNINSKESLPLVEGMFCTVKIPGHVIENVYKLPREAVNFENKVYIFDKNSRLKEVSVNIVKEEDEYVFVDEGVNSSDIIVITRLVDPLEGTLLKVDGEILEETLS